MYRHHSRDVKFAFIFGGNYGRGWQLSYRAWLERPHVVAVEGGSVGYQIGARPPTW